MILKYFRIKVASSEMKKRINLHIHLSAKKDSKLIDLKKKIGLRNLRKEMVVIEV
jgi:hypothetical protein